MAINCVIYHQSGNDGLDRLRQVAAERGWTVKAVFQDDPLTAPEQRSGYKAMRRMLDMGVVQALLVPSLVDLADTVDGLVRLMAKLVAADVSLLVMDDKIDTGTPEGAAWLATVASLASYKQSVRKQRARIGQIRSMSNGTKFGRPSTPPRVIEEVRIALRKNDEGVRAIGRRLGISASRVHAEKVAMIAERRG